MRVLLSLYCFIIGSAFVYLSWWVAWVAGYTSETWIWIVSAIFVCFGLCTFAAIVTSWRNRHRRVAKAYFWASVLMVLPIAGLYGINGYGSTELSMTLFCAIVLYLNGRAMSGLFRDWP